MSCLIIKRSKVSYEELWEGEKVPERKGKYCLVPGHYCGISFSHGDLGEGGYCAVPYRTVQNSRDVRDEEEDEEERHVYACDG